MRIIKARYAQVQEIKKLLSDTWTHTYKNIYSPETIKNATATWHDPKLLNRQIKDPKVYFGLVKEHDHIVGLITVRELENHTLMMYRLYIHPLYQRKGIGSKLLDKATKTFRGAQILRLEVEEQNKKGVSFYVKMGFKQTGRKYERIGKETIPVVEMEKKL